MNTPIKILRLLKNDASNWWYHKQLRENGNTVEAKKLELKSIKSNINTLRKATHFSIGRGGATVQMNDASYLCTYGDTEIIQCCILLGLPGYDTREVTDFNGIWELTKGYLFNEKLKIAESIGAKIYNKIS